MRRTLHIIENMSYCTVSVCPVGWVSISLICESKSSLQRFTLKPRIKGDFCSLGTRNPTLYKLLHTLVIFECCSHFGINMCPEWSGHKWTAPSTGVNMHLRSDRSDHNLKWPKFFKQRVCTCVLGHIEGLLNCQIFHLVHCNANLPMLASYLLLYSSH